MSDQRGAYVWVGGNAHMTISFSSSRPTENFLMQIGRAVHTGGSSPPETCFVDRSALANMEIDAARTTSTIADGATCKKAP